MKKAIKESNLVLEYSQNIERFVSLYLTIDDMRTENWYIQESKNIRKIAKRLGVSPLLVASVIAVTSPMKKWNENKSWAIDIIKFGLGHDSNPYQGLYSSLGKAFYLVWLYLENELTIDKVYEQTNIKTQAFFDNLYQPKKSKLFTVDIWMFRLAIKEWQNPTNIFKLTAMQKRAIHKAYSLVYDKLQLHAFGIMPHMLQSALWLAIKDNKIASQWLTDFDNIARFVSPNGETTGD